MNIYFIGGSSCAGKTTAARRLAQTCDLYYYGVDDHLGQLAEYGIKHGFPVCLKHSRMSMDEYLMRPPYVQCEELILFYTEIHAYLMETIRKLDPGRPVLAEGIAFIPELMQKDNIGPDRYTCLLAAPEFQEEHYRKREWTEMFLKECKDRTAAFQNWMEREKIFTGKIRKQAARGGYKVFDVSSEEDLEDMTVRLERHVCVRR